MSAYPLMLEGTAVQALVVGGGAVAERKARALLAAGARVRLVAPTISEGVRKAASDTRLVVIERAYEPGDIGDATLVIAATDAREINAGVAADARALARLVNVADAPAEGNCTTPATHRAGDVVIAVSAGGAPAAAARIRDAIAERFDGRYGAAVAQLVALRARLLSAGDGAAWRSAADRLVGPDFCPLVERGEFTAEAAS